MKRSSLAELESRFSRREAFVIPWLLGIVAGMAVPIMVIIVGWMVELLIRASLDRSLPASIQLGPRLSLSTVWLDAAKGPLRGVLALMISALGMATIEAIMLLGLYRWAVHFALDGEIWLQRHLYETNLRLASRQSVIGHRPIHVEAATHWIPQVRDGLLAWYRTVPRHSVQFLACFVLAIAIHPTLMFLATIAFVLLWQLYSLLDRRRRRLRPVLAERSHAAQSKLIATIERGPLTALIHPEMIHRESFEGQLRTYREAESKLCDNYLWKTPLLVAMVALMLGIFSLSLSVRILQDSSTLGVAAAIVMLVLIGLGYVSILKVKRAWTRMRSAELAAGRILEILNQVSPSSEALSTTAIPPLQQHLTLENVTLRDTRGQTMLEDVSFQVRPRMLVALVATSAIEAQTLSELLLGLGVPSSGRVLWDSLDTKTVAPSSIQQHCGWVAPDGPMISGTLIENLSERDTPRSMSEIIEAVRLSGAYEAVSELTDAFSTFISPSDDRLKHDALYQLGIARGLLRNKSIVVAHEPAERVANDVENRSVAALRQLTQRGCLVFVVPQRLSGLRQADLVVLLHEKRVASLGTHNELLEKSELYRHFNYVRFSNLRDISIR